MSTPLGRTATLLEKILDTSPTGIMVLNSVGEISMANERAVALLGAADDTELLGKQYDDTAWNIVDSSGEPIPDGEHPYVEVVDSKESVFARELGIERIDGERIWVSMSLAPILDDEDELEGTAVTFSDITERRLTEQALEDEREQLEAVASIIAHDLRNPLAIIHGYVETIEETGDLQYLQQIKTAAHRMEAIIDDVLTFARIGEKALETTEVDLETVVASAWENVETGEATVVYERSLTLEADRSRLLQLFENLFRNAIEHGGQNPTVTVGALPEDDGFFLEDDGPGIPADKRNEVLSFGYSTKTEGTGLGLSIVRQIAEAHGWSVSIADGDTGGARFEIQGIAQA